MCVWIGGTMDSLALVFATRHTGGALVDTFAARGAVTLSSKGGSLDSFTSTSHLSLVDHSGGGGGDRATALEAD